MQINREFASKVLETVNAGLVGGLGEAKLGSMCVEAAVKFAMGEAHGDDPTCVGTAVRSFMIRLNDANWPTDRDRTNTLRKLSIAQLGSNTIDQHAFADLLVLGTVRKMVPIALRAAAKHNPKFADGLEAASVACEEVKGRAEARTAALAARDMARKVRADAAAAAYAAAAADAAADAAAAADAYAYADAAAAAYAARLAALQAAAQIGLNALIELKSPGVEFLNLCE